MVTVAYTTRQTGSFDAKRSDTGEIVRVYVFTRFVDCSSLDGHSEVPGISYLELGDGNKVNRICKGHYQSVFPQVDLFTDDPNAP